jgi:CheY-like chemotaxis protein
MPPFRDGPSILKQLRQNPGFASTQVIFMTARAQPEEIAEYRSLGCIDVIVKPFDARGGTGLSALPAAPDCPTAR